MSRGGRVPDAAQADGRRGPGRIRDYLATNRFGRVARRCCLTRRAHTPLDLVGRSGRAFLGSSRSGTGHWSGGDLVVVSDLAHVACVRGPVHAPPLASATSWSLHNRLIVLLGMRRVDGAGFDVLDALGIAVIGSTALAVVGLVWVARDRARLKVDGDGLQRSLERTELQLAEAGSRYKMLVEHVPAAVYIDMADVGVTDGGRLAYMSPQIRGILGFRPEEFMTDPELWPSRLHPDDRAEALAAYVEHWRTGQPLRAEYRMIARDGTEVWVRDEAFAMPEETITGRSYRRA